MREQRGLANLHAEGTLGGGSPAVSLKNLLSAINLLEDCVVGTEQVVAVTSDSRKVKEGSLFVAIQGLVADGHAFISQAVENGCLAVVVQKGCEHLTADLSVPCFKVEDSRIALAQIAARFYGNPADQLTLVGITGTNGKTTITYLLESLIRESGGNPGVIGTVNYRYNGLEFDAPFTTPEPVLLHGLLHEMLHNGVTHVVMEVSSHALAQKRVYGLKFDAALFTNLSRDHLDFHLDMKDYFEAKKSLFTEHLKEGCQAVVTRDLPEKRAGERGWGSMMFRDLSSLSLPVVSCGLGADDDVHPNEYICSLKGINASLELAGEVIRFDTPLVGEFNLKNILGAIGVAKSLGISATVVEKALHSVDQIPGRLQRVTTNQEVEVYVDYAHTPDALENVLTALRKLCGDSKITVVFGCGGERDRGKRPLMGEVAGRLADTVIITADNSRSESTENIISEIEPGVKLSGKRNVELDGSCVAGKIGISTNEKVYLIRENREEAIERAVIGAQDNDVVLISGKGHENYQILQGRTLSFDDCEEARKYLEKRSKSNGMPTQGNFSHA